MCYAGYIRQAISGHTLKHCSSKLPQLQHTRWVGLRQAFPGLSAQPSRFLLFLDKCMPDGRHFEGLEWEQKRPESWHVELTSCRRSAAVHQHLLQFCCAWLREPPEPPCEVHPRLFPLHCTSTLSQWDASSGCAHPHYPSGVHAMGYMVYRLCP
jgi:hypothetical protein